MTYKIVLIHEEEGYTVECPELPGCITEGDTAEEAMENMKSAIQEYLAIALEIKRVPERLEVEFLELQVA